MSTEARWLIRDRDRGGRGQKNEGANTHTDPTRKTEEAVDHHQNNGSVTAVSPPPDL